MDWGSYSTVYIDGEEYPLASVEMTTGVSFLSVSMAIADISMEPHLYHVQKESLEDPIPKYHIFQMIHQMFVLDLNLGFFLCTAETGDFFTAVLYCPNRIKNEAKSSLVQTPSGTVSTLPT